MRSMIAMQAVRVAADFQPLPRRTVELEAEADRDGIGLSGVSTEFAHDCQARRSPSSYRSGGHRHASGVVYWAMRTVERD